MPAASPRNAPRGLTPDRIGGAALALLDREGAAGLSARRLAAALGCEAMSLYNHVEGMEGVLDLVVDRLLAGLLPALAAVDDDPRQALSGMARLYLETAERHPHAFVLVATRRWRTPAAVQLAGGTLARIAALGLPPREALRRARALGAYLNGAGLALAAWRSLPEGEGAVPVPDPALDGAFNAEAVREDLLAGLDRLIDRLA
jgi:AcrR family transcriptional regulator